MYLKRLSLHGYKTFANPTDFEFDSGITAIVGPNGSGKSNIADAVRWVLGEQSFSTLRAKKTEDMIFAGGKQRARLGMAEASLTFDNSDRWLDTEFTEVTVTRRAYRSGENEYLLNGSRVRLRDILEILGKAGLGRSTYIVIGQGLVDAALSLRPVERRALIEEAAGVANYLAKRKATMTRLDETKQNMLRVNDIIHEITPRLRRLERQAKRAEEHALLARDLSNVLRIWYGYQWHTTVRRMTEAEGKLTSQESRLADQRTKLRALGESLQQIRERRLGLVQRLSVWRQEQANLLSQVEERRRAMAVNQERTRQYKRQAAQIREEVASTGPRSKVIASAIASGELELERLIECEAADSATLGSLRQELDLLDRRRDEAKTQLTQAQERSYRLAADVAAARSELLQIESRADQTKADISQHERLLEERSAQREALSEQLTNVDRVLAQLEEKSAAVEAGLDGKRSDLATCMETQAKLRTSTDRAHAKTEKLTARFEMLDRMRRESSGYNPAVRGLLGRRERVPGIIGPIANLMKVPEELEKAVDAALGHLVQAIVVKDWTSVEAASTLLQELDDGQATLICLDHLPRRKPSTRRLPAQAIGTASELIGYAKEYEPLFGWLLGDVVLVRDLADAREFSAQLRNAGARVVTLAGETFGSGATVTVGPRKVEASLLRQEREWRALPERISSAQQEEKLAVSALAEEEKHQQELQQEITRLDGQRDQFRLEARDAEARRAQLRKEHAAVDGEIAWREKALAQSTSDLKADSERRDALRQQLQAAQDEQSVQAEEIARLRQSLEGLVDSGLRKRIAKLETSLAVTQRSRQSQTDLLESHRANLRQLEQQVKEKQERVERLGRECTSIETETGALRDETEGLSQRLESVRQSTGPAEKETEALEQARGERATEERQARERLRQFESTLSQVSLDKARIQDALDRLTQEIEEALGPVQIPADPARQLQLGMGPDAVPLPTTSALPEGLEQEIKNLRARLKRISPVNPTAPEEHAEALERHSFLLTQSHDLEEAMAALHDVIAELDEIIETDFRAAFKAAAREFKHYFSLLFRGGTAKLVLADPEDINSGIDITARPPGKRSQSLSLLSGGERSLTATALLFALLKVNPLPFCILDEVDAMLDEANVGRFREVLQELSVGTQFIVISHNRVTIEAARAIYGVSMQEDGTSKTISLRMPGRQESETPKNLEEALWAGGTQEVA